MKINCCWLYAISKYGYPPSLSDTYRVIQEMVDLGFNYIELEGIGERNLNELFQNRQRIKKLVQDIGIKIVNFCPVLSDLVSMEDRKRRKALQLFSTALELASFFECKTIQLDSYTPPLKFKGASPYQDNVDFGQQFEVIVDPDFDWKNQWEVLVDTMNICAEQSKKAGLKLCLEPRVGEMVSNSDGAMRLIDAVGDENFGVILDTGHLHAQKEILPLSVEKLNGSIFYVHTSDNDGCSNEHLPLGKGTIDWEGLFLALQKHKFNGYVGIDLGRITDLDTAMRNSKQFLEKLAVKMGL